MSGLAGYAFLDGAEHPEERLRRAAAAFSGPSHGLEIHTETDFGVVVASRFEARDTASRSFGEIARDERYVLACEGYIVNLGDLADLADLTGSGAAQPRGRVLLDLYSREGDALFAKLNGGFTLVIWDRVERRLALTLTKFGYRHLYHRETGEGLVFGSEIKVLPVLSGLPLEIDEAGLGANLTAGLNYGTGTCFRGVRRYFQGSVGRAGRGSHRVTLPEFLPVDAEKTTRGLEELVDELDGLMRRAVGRLTDVHPEHAVLMSSGVDSVLVAGYMKQITGRLRTITQARPGMDESADAARIAAFLGADHHGVSDPVDGAGLLHGLDALVTAMEEPMSGQFGLPLYSLTRSASSLARTFLNGLGAGLFGLFSYARFDDSERTLFNYIPRPYDPNGIRLILPVPDQGREDFTEIVTSRLSANRFDRKVSSWLLGNISRHIIGIGGAIAQSMGAEALYPYLDDDAVLFAYTVPDDLKIDGEGERIKPLLYALLDRQMPRDLLSQAKRGYWAHGGENTEAKGVLGWCYETGTLDPALDLLSEQRSLERGLYNRTNLEKLLTKYRNRQAEEGWHRILWQILSFELFCRRFLDAPQPELEAGAA